METKMTKTLAELHKEWQHATGFHADISPSSIDDVIWYGKADGLTKLYVLPAQLNIIWQFLAANIGETDTQMRREYFVEGKCSRILGVDIEVLPYANTPTC